MGQWIKGTANLRFAKNSPRLARLNTPLLYRAEDGRVWFAKAGLLFDGASIPKLFWWLIGSPFTGWYRRWAIIHDQYYKEHDGRPRKEVDQQFYKGIKEDGVSWLKAWAIYTAVRIGGKGAWDASKKVQK